MTWHVFKCDHKEVFKYQCGQNCGCLLMLFVIESDNYAGALSL